MSRSHAKATPVVCLHSSGSSGRQWASLQTVLAPVFDVIAPDLQGYGKMPVWPKGQSLSLQVEADILGCLLQRHDEPVHLVGHSYGAGVAVRMALNHPDRVRSLSLYEPTLFSLLLSETSGPNPVDEVLAVAAKITRCLERDDNRAAARCFVNYWGGDQAWAQLNDGQQERLAQRARKAPADFHALFGAGIDAATLRRLDIPVLCLYGAETRLPARLIAQRLGATLPRIELLRLPAMGHMGPMTHPVIISALIGDFLHRQALRAPKMTAVRSEEEIPHYRAIPGLTLVATGAEP